MLVYSFIEREAEKPSREMPMAGDWYASIYSRAEKSRSIQGAGKVKWEGGSMCCPKVGVRKGGSRVQDHRGRRPDS